MERFIGMDTVMAWLLNPTLVSPQDHWGIWTALFATGAFGLFMVSAALVSTLVGLGASNVGIVPCEAPAYSVVMEFLLPLTVRLLLFRADKRQVIRSTGTLLLAFLLGSVATMVGTIVAFLLVPVKSLGQDSWKIAAVVMGSYTGGESLGVSPSVLAAGVAVDNVICAALFVLLFLLASTIPPEPPASTTAATNEESSSGNKLPPLQHASALAAAFIVCKSGAWITKLSGFKGGHIPAITVIVIILATLLPKHFGYLAPAGENIAMVLMQVFFAVVVASGSIWNVITMAPNIFIFAFVQVAVLLAVILGFGKLFCLDLKLLLLASNASIGGPTTACGMVMAKGWSSLVASGVLTGIFRVSIATFLGIDFGMLVLRHL
ncbi:hypothetical protein NMG60_11018089 [Bertholletia excelsa]